MRPVEFPVPCHQAGWPSPAVPHGFGDEDGKALLLGAEGWHSRGNGSMAFHSHGVMGVSKMVGL